MSIAVACIQQVDDDSFAAMIDYSKNHSDNLLIVDFYADWCSPCKMLTPIFCKIAEDYCFKTDKIKFYSADANESGNSMENFSIKSIPTLLFLKGGEKVDSLTGAQAEDVIVKQIESCLNVDKK